MKTRLSSSLSVVVNYRGQHATKSFVRRHVVEEFILFLSMLIKFVFESFHSMGHVAVVAEMGRVGCVGDSIVDHLNRGTVQDHMCELNWREVGGESLGNRGGGSSTKSSKFGGRRHFPSSISMVWKESKAGFRGVVTSSLCSKANFISFVSSFRLFTSSQFVLFDRKA